MKFQIIKTNKLNKVIGTHIVEAKSKVAAIKSLYTSEITIGYCKDGTYTVGANHNQYCDVYAFNRVTLTVTEVVEVVEVVATEATNEVVEVVAEVVAEVIAEPTIETYVADLVKTYTVAKLAEIIAEYADAKVRAYQVLCARAQAELATR
jgi:hypothetical protein